MISPELSTDETSDSHHEDTLKKTDLKRKHSDYYTRNVNKKKRNLLPDWVSDWKKKHAERLHIYYDKDFLESPVDVLNKIGNNQTFSDYQKLYMEKIKSYLTFDAVYNETTHSDYSYNEFYKSFMKPVLDTILQKISVNEDTEPRLIIANCYVADFINDISYLLKRIEEDITKTVPEEVYTSIVSSFATMCFLKPRVGKEDPTTWTNLFGLNVISKPDLRLYKKGTPSAFERPKTVVSVVEVKKGIQKDTNYLKSSDTSSSASGSEDEATRPQIMTELNERILGRHAGELLLDFNRFAIKNKMPGMIVNGTKVIFTLLDMPSGHYCKLAANQQLDNSTDKATIYYSKPLNILINKDRDILIEAFMKLNNLPEHKTKPSISPLDL